MRLYEGLLFFSNVGVAFAFFFLKGRTREISLYITSLISAIFLFSHLLLEGYRFHLLFCTIFTGIMFTRCVLQKKFLKPSKRLISGFFIFASLIATAAAVFVFPVFELPTPTGTYDVGTEVFHFVDLDRDEIFTDKVDDKRALMVQVWYPAKAVSGKPTPFLDDERLLNVMASGYGLPGFSFNHLKYVRSHGYSKAEISESQSAYPLIIMNHGFGSSKSLHTSQAENLASHGYIVASIDHTYNTFGTLFPDGMLTTNDTSDLFSANNDYETEKGNRDLVGKVLTDDVAFVLDQFEAINSGHILSKLSGKVDMSHVGTIGHSIGGATAYDAAFDERITAGVNLDGGLYLINANEGLNKPFLFMLSESGYESLNRVMTGDDYSDEELEKMGNSREWNDAVIKDKKIEIERMKHSALSGGEIVYVEGSEHLNFTDVQHFSPIFKVVGATGKIKVERADLIVNAYVLAFFDRHLRETTGSSSSEVLKLYPEIMDVTSTFLDSSK
jgi:dienelactone hydrolase